MSGSVSRFRRTKSAAVGAVAGNGLEWTVERYSDEVSSLRGR